MVSILRLIAIIGLVLVFVGACRKSKPSAEDVLNVPVEPSQRALAMGGIADIQINWNTGDCNSIYNGAAQTFVLSRRKIE